MNIETLESRKLFSISAMPLIAPTSPLPTPMPVLPSLFDTRVIQEGRTLRINGGIGNDNMLIQESFGRITIRSNAQAFSFPRANFDLVRVNGNSGNDSIWAAGSQLPLIIDGGDGNDVLRGGDRNDNLLGGSGDDTLYSSPGADVYRGGTGTFDALDRNEATGPLHITLDGIANDGFTGENDNVHTDVEVIRGGRSNDVFQNPGANRVQFFGNGGNDVLAGGSGIDVLNGGEGHDTFHGRGGNDLMIGMGGNDIALGGAGVDEFQAGSWTGTEGTTIVVGVTTAVPASGQFDRAHTDVERLTGSAYADTIRGGTSAETIRGGGGNDSLFGGAGNDFLDGGDGNDTLFGQGGDDQMEGNNGNDILIGLGGGTRDRYTGGAGEDVIWADDHSDELIFGVSASETRQRFVNRVGSFANGAGIEPAGEPIANPAADRPAAWRNFSNRPIFAQPASLNDIKQGALGNCWWMAAAGGVAQRNPDFLRGAVVPFADGTFGVRLADSFYRIDGQLPVNSAGNLIYADLAQGGGTWVALMEKAMVLHRTTSLPHNHNQYGRLTAGSTGDGFSHIGFNDQNKHGADVLDVGNAWGWMNTQLAMGRAVTFCTTVVICDSPMVGHHCYNVIATGTDTSGRRFVTIRNPWGRDHNDSRHWSGANDGVLTVRFEVVNSKVLEYVAARTSL